MISLNEAQKIVEEYGFKVNVSRSDNEYSYVVKIIASNNDYYELASRHIGDYNPNVIVDWLRKYVKNEKDLKQLSFAIQKLIDSQLPCKLEFTTIDSKGRTIKIEGLMSNGLVVKAHGFFIKIDGNYIVSEGTFIYCKKQIIDKHKEREFESIEPIIAYSVYESNNIVERKVIPARYNDKIIFNNKPIKIKLNVMNINETLSTFMHYETITRFLKGDISKPLNEIFNEIKKKLEEYIDFYWDNRLYDLISCYIISTYFFDLFSAFPRLFIYGAFQSGKTRLTLFIVNCSRHGITFLDPSDASSYRGIDALAPTLGIDESVLSSRLIKIISAGYKRGLKVPRIASRNEKFILEMLNSYAPVVMNSTEDLREILKQRCIIITMKISNNKNLKNEDPTTLELENIREELYLARLTRLNEVINAYNTIKNQIPLTSRPRELWLPILTIAKAINDNVYNNMLSLAIEDLNKRSEELYTEERLILEVIERLFEEERQKTLDNFNEKDNAVSLTISFTASEIYGMLKWLLIEERGELTERQFEKLWSPTKIGIVLKRSLNLKSKRTSSKRLYELSFKQFQELKQLYSLSAPMTLVTLMTLNSKGESVTINGQMSKSKLKISGENKQNIKEKIEVMDKSKEKMTLSYSKNSVTSVISVTTLKKQESSNQSTNHLIEIRKAKRGDVDFSKVEQLYRYIELNFPYQGQLLTFMNLNNIPKSCLSYLIMNNKVKEQIVNGEIRFMPQHHEMTSLRNVNFNVKNLGG